MKLVDQLPDVVVQSVVRKVQQFMQSAFGVSASSETLTLTVKQVVNEMSGFLAVKARDLVNAKAETVDHSKLGLPKKCAEQVQITVNNAIEIEQKVTLSLTC